MKQIIATEQAPAAIGPYSQGTSYGDMVYTSGQLPRRRHQRASSSVSRKLKSGSRSKRCGSRHCIEDDMLPIRYGKLRRI